MWPHRHVAVGVLTGAISLILPSVAGAAPPANDSFAGRQTVASIPFEDGRSTVEATTEPGEPDSPCGRVGKTVWYQYTPPSDLVLKADTRGSDYDTMLAVWTGSGLNALTHVGCSDGFDFLRVEWTADGQNWVPISRFTGQSDGYPAWTKLTLGFDSPGGDVQVRFRFTSDLLCSGVDPACGRLYAGTRVDEVVIGRQAA